MKAVIYHNPRCMKSRQAVEALRAGNVETEIVEYLKTPPSLEVLGKLSKMLGCKPSEMIRKREAVYAELNLSQQKDEKILLQAMAENPILLERPIIVMSGRAVIGRPSEKTEEFIKERKHAE